MLKTFKIEYSIKVQILRFIVILLFGIFGLAESSWAATYYISPTGNNSNSCATAQSNSTPKLTFASAWGCLSAGDTLIAADGTYNGDPSPPAGKSGAAGNPITVQAANDGEAKIVGSLDLSGNSYLTFIGFKVTGVGYAIYQYSNGTGAPSHHNTFQRIGFNCTDTTLNDNACFDMSDGTHHTLLEDSWGWGGGRYTVMMYGGNGGSPPNVTADYNTIRRVVLRMGPSTSSGGNPQAALMPYTASNNIIENVIAIDGRAASDTSNAGFYLGDHPGSVNADNNVFYGVIALNNYGSGWYIDSDGIANNNKIYNSVVWGSPDDSLVCYTANSPSQNIGTIISGVTAGGSSTGSGLDNYRCGGVSVKNSMFINNSLYGAINSGGGSVTENYNDFYNNGSGARTGLSAGANSITSNPGLLYLPRIESNSPAHSAGEGGEDIGANVIKRYQDGVLTSADLWPWPHEARIKKEMCTDAGVTSGFCSTGKQLNGADNVTLTSYIWEYLGNQIPADIYGGSSDTTPPSAPQGLTVN